MDKTTMDKIKRYNVFVLFLFMISCTTEQNTGSNMNQVKTLDLSQYSAASPDKPIDLLFIHHSTGGQLLADKGPEKGENCIYTSHPNGGGLRRLLEENNYIVHEASYKSQVGDKTDICHWHNKFKDSMDKILSCKHQDEFFTDGTRNRIVIFKSCFPNNNIVSDGTEPGKPDACELTLANAQAAYQSILPFFQQHPETLFVVMTAPPLAKPVQDKKDRIIEYLKIFSGRPDTLERIATRARRFNNWLVDVEDGWLKGYSLKNVVVFDYYDVLTGHGRSNWSVFPTREGTDSHPSREGNALAAERFVPFLHRAVARMDSH
jgi:hypothetical protein